MNKKTWEVTAHETIVHSWTVEAETEEEARELAGSGCPHPDWDCQSTEFEITKLKIEGAPEQVRDLIERVEVEDRKYRLEVFESSGGWHTAIRGLTHAEALEEAKAFTRFRIIDEEAVSL